MKKIAFIGHDLKFIRHIINYLENDLNYQVRVDEWTGHEIHNENYSLELVEWADILFCEWGLGNVVWYQTHKKPHQKLFVRLHRFEMNTKYPAMFNHDKVDQYIAISPFIFEEFNRVAKIPRSKMKVIFNAIDVERFQIPKKKGCEYNLGIIGIVPKLKRLDRALDVFEKLYEKNPNYQLFIKGKHPKEYGWVWNNPSQRSHYEQIFGRIENSKYKNNVYIEGWGDVAEWLKNIGYVFSVSDYESFHMAPIEGMASGAYPLVLRREGVQTIFPKDLIVDDLDEMVTALNNDHIWNETTLQEFVKQNYSLQEVCGELNNLFQD